MAGLRQRPFYLTNNVLWASTALWVSLMAKDAWPADAIAPEVAEIYNLVENGGFEKGGALPEYWNRHPAKDADGNRLLRDTTMAHCGQASGLIVGALLQPGRTAPNLQWNKYGVRVEGGSALILSCYVKTEGTTPYRVGCHFYDQNRKHLGFKEVRFPEKSSEWVYLRDRVAVPKDARQMGFVLYAKGTGKTWFDDVAVLGTPSTAAVRGTPVVDGKLDDRCWASSPPISQFVVHTGAKLPCEQTRAWIAFDDQALVVAFHCPHPQEAKLRALATEHDGDVWLDESVEVFLDPRHEHDDYFQICVNREGHTWDSHGTDTAWESGAEAAVHRDPAAWSVEVKIPYDRLAIDLDVGQSWGINLVRNDRVHNETSTWSLGGFHDAGRFGNVTLKPDLWRFRRIALARELDNREREIERLRQALGDVGMTAVAKREPNRLLTQAERQIAALRQRIRTPAGADETALLELKQELATLADIVPKARSTATEYLFATDEGQAGGFRVALAHSLQKVPRTGAWGGGLFAKRLQLAAAANESESFQLIVIPAGAALEQVNVETTSLQGPGGSIPIEWHRVDYVETLEPRYPTAYVGWWPDPLLPPGPFDVAKGSRQPLWFRVSVPPGTGPGTYVGQVTICHGQQHLTVPVELRVRDFSLPRPGTLATAFGNYAFALALGYYGKSDYRKCLAAQDYARWCDFMGQYRLGPKNSGREYISITRQGDAWHADLSTLQTTICKSATKYYAPYSLAVHRLPSAPQLDKPDYHPSPADWARQTQAIANEWRRIGLPAQAFIYGIDEPKPSQYPFLREVYQRLHTQVPGYPILQTVNHREPTELAGLVDIWCPLSSRLESDFYAQRLKAGDTLWLYVCCGPTHPYANFFIDRPATEHRVLFWQARQAGATGVLYWCACWWQGLPTPGAGTPRWPEVPIRMKDHRASVPHKINGDGLLIYPGPKRTPYPSIRLEVIRDGIEDYEYLALLDRLLQRATSPATAKQLSPELLATAQQLCHVPATISRSMTDYTEQPDDIFDRRRLVGDMIETLAGMPAKQ